MCFANRSLADLFAFAPGSAEQMADDHRFELGSNLGSNGWLCEYVSHCSIRRFMPDLRRIACCDPLYDKMADEYNLQELLEVGEIIVK